ncbi:MAG: type I CRISPR-associated protein Cas7 [Verrucomicrobiota bacterium]|nr:type I CRISPR-associated protein Cas7 [Verrucomicrobiota bacterium]
MIKVNKIDKQTGNLYILFGHEAIQARPNLDPYTSTLRMKDETMQVYTSDVHIKHHARRGIKAYALENELGSPASAVFYEKNDDAGNARDFSKRIELIRAENKIEKKQQDKRDALHHCLDLPLFGYVHAVKNENFSVTNAINTLFRPVTFHSCEIMSLGRNNAFPSLNSKTGEVKEAAGSATVDSLEYGFFLSLWEINLNMLKINTKDHKVINLDKKGIEAWLKVFINGLWKAYTSDRYPSFTQRSQFAQFAIGWQPSGDVSYANPADLIENLEEKKVTNHADAVDALNDILPDFLQGWNCDSNTQFVKHTSPNCKLNI